MWNAVVQWKAPHSGCLSERGRRGAPLSKILPPVLERKTGRVWEEGAKEKKKRHTKTKRKGNPPWTAILLGLSFCGRGVRLREQNNKDEIRDGSRVGQNETQPRNLSMIIQWLLYIINIIQRRNVQVSHQRLNVTICLGKLLKCDHHKKKIGLHVLPTHFDRSTNPSKSGFCCFAF